MDASIIKDYLLALKYELIKFKSVLVVVFVSITLTITVLAFFLPKSYETKAIIFADQTNIIEPLLKGRAEITEINRSDEARDLIYTRRLLDAVAKSINALDGNESAGRHEAILSDLRKTIDIRSESKTHFSLSYKHVNPDVSFETLNAVVNVFIEETARQKKEESLSAYTFIDTQVQSYRRQLKLAEEKLKTFKADNVDGTEASVNSQISLLRAKTEDIKIDIEESNARIGSIKKQLSNESEYQEVKGRLQEHNLRREFLLKELESLRLSYQESYPDIVSLKTQLAELDSHIENVRSKESVVSSGVEGKLENPLYEELRKQLSDAEVNKGAQERRLSSTEKLLDQEYARAQKVAGNQAELSELTRDYDVIREVYEEMLSRKESARLSMTLDIEGQGVSYKIQEPAAFPLRPSGLRFIHLALLAPFLGLLLPLALLVVYIVVDPRFRSVNKMHEELPDDIELLGVVPHYNTPLASRILRKDVRHLLFVGLAAMLTYIIILSLGIAFDA